MNSSGHHKTGRQFVKYLLLFTLLHFFGTVHAQTKEETEKWIVEKLSKHMKEKSYWAHSYYEDRLCNIYNYKYIPLGGASIHGNIMIIKFAYVQLSKQTRFCGGDYTERVDSKFTVSDTIILNEIKKLAKRKATEDKTYDISSKQTALSYGDKEWIVLESEKGGRYHNLFIIGNEEDDLLNRLQKALDHLKTFYPKPKETF